MPAAGSAIARWKHEAIKQGFVFLSKTKRPPGIYANYKCMECGEEKEALIQHMRDGSVQCQPCRNAREEFEANRAGFTMLDRFVRNSGMSNKTTTGRYRCNTCSLEREAVVTAVKRGDIICAGCASANRQAESAKVNLTYLGTFRRGRVTRGNYSCDACNGQFDADIGAVKRGHVSCPLCAPAASAGERFIKDRLASLGASFSQQASVKIDGRTRRFDFDLSDRIIEFDGQQHFHPESQLSRNPQDFLDVVAPSDLHKNLYCIYSRIPLIRIHYNVRTAGLLSEAVDLALTLDVDPEEPVYLTAIDGSIEVIPVVDFLFNDGADRIRTASN